MATPAFSAAPASPQRISALTELIGNTPLIRLGRVADPAGATVWAKAEQYNPGGSIKDRIALAMIEAAERERRIRPDGPEASIIVEPTSGNTGVGLALVCAAKGYRLILTMPESMSLERRALLESYGATIVLTPAARDMEGAVERAHELVAADPRYFMPDQFRNPANPEIHRQTTAVEILAQLDAPVAAFVAAVGTGGTITGVGDVLRQRYPRCRVIAVEPARSAVLSGQPPGLHKIQGIGAGFVPAILDRDVITEIVTIQDGTAYDMAKRLAREEGLLVGISAGANVAVACDVARSLSRDDHVVTILCDTGERYFSLIERFEAEGAQ